MRKYIIGALAGAALMFGIQAGASDLLTGSKVAGTKDVTFNGKTIGHAAIINNSSYLPVRALADAAALKIDLSGGTINLSSEQQLSDPAASTGSAPGQVQPSLTADQIKARIDEIDKQLDYAESTVSSVQTMIDALISQGRSDDVAQWQKTLDENKDAIPKLQQQKADLEAQLEALQGQ